MDSDAMTSIIRTTIILVMIQIMLDGGTINFKEKVDKTELKYLANAMELENGYNGDECMLLTGCVVINRRNSQNWKGDTCKDVIMAKGQYADSTRNNVKTHKAGERATMLAKFLLIYGDDLSCYIPANVVYQGMTKNGSGLYKTLKNLPGQKSPEYFCFE